MRKFYKKLRAVWKLVSLLILTLAAYSYAMFQGGFVSWFLFYSFFPFAVYALLLLFYPVRSFQAARTVSQEQYTAGQRLIGTITINRKFPFPLFYLLVEDKMTEKLQESKEGSEPKKLFFPWFKRRVSFSYILLQLPRGEHRLSTIRMRTGDPFGLIEKEMAFDVENTFLVYPSFIDFRYYPQQRRFEQGSASMAANYLHDSTMAVGSREYQPGDKLSWIDWKATARRDSIMTKEFEQMQSHDVVIVLDRTESDMFEAIVVYTASLLRAILKSGARAGLVSLGSDSHIFPLQSDEEHGRNMFYHLAKVDCDSKYPLSALLERQGLQAEMKQVTNIIVTSQLTVDFVRKLEQFVRLQQAYMLFVIKSIHRDMSHEETTLIERLRKRHIDVKIISSRDDGREYKEVREG